MPRVSVKAPWLEELATVLQELEIGCMAWEHDHLRDAALIRDELYRRGIVLQYAKKEARGRSHH